MANPQTITIGAVLQIDNALTKITNQSQKGSDREMWLYNQGTKTVFITWDYSIPVVLDTTTARDKSGYIPAGGSLPVPKNVGTFGMQCAGTDTTVVVAVGK